MGARTWVPRQPRTRRGNAAANGWLSSLARSAAIFGINASLDYGIHAVTRNAVLNPQRDRTLAFGRSLSATGRDHERGFRTTEGCYR